MPPLPIDALLPDILRRLKTDRGLVLRAPTGAGKTTRVPPALLGLGPILVVEPRRLAARAAARYMAEERGERVGGTIGHHVRFDRQVGPNTRLVVATPGILLRMFHDDAAIEPFAVVVFDEFHERGLESDLALGMCRLLQETVRPDLRIVVMSATLETGNLAEYFGGTSLTSEGRLFPIDIEYAPPPLREPIADSVAGAVMTACRRRDGDVLAFLPGVGEIRQTAARLASWAREESVLVTSLYGDLPAAEQDRALKRQDRRRVVLATNVAETSVTVEGISIVVDSGLARQVQYDPAVGLDRLELTPISRASSDQRAGRAGRLGPGLCVRLWSEAGHRMRTEQTEPEIRRVDLAGPMLQLMSLGERDLEAFPWLEAPKPAAVAQSRTTLERLGAIADGQATPLGRAMARLPVHPRLARMLLEGARLGIVDDVALAAAVLSERDPFLSDDGRSAAPTTSDLFDRVAVLSDFERTGQTRSPFGTINVPAAQHLFRVRDQLIRNVRDEDVRDKVIPPELTPGRPEVPLLAAFPDRLARRRDNDPRRGVMVGGRGVRLLPQSGVVAGELFLCLDVDAGDREALVRLASAIPRDALPAGCLRAETRLDFDESTERVTARKQVMFDDLVVEESPAHLPGGERVADVLAAAAGKRLDRVRPADDSPAGQFLVRVQWLRERMPGLGLPTFDAVDFREIVAWLAPGKKSFAELRSADWLAAIGSRLTHSQRQAVDREAPERWTVPSGSRIALRYEAGRPPILAVRIQELFGLRETPRVAGGSVKVLLHLLGPNFRPEQVTDDLASFWKNTYPVVRKELRVRYPRHAWPEDPLAAEPQRGAKRR